MKKRKEKTNNPNSGKHSKNGVIAFVENNLKYILATIAIIIAIIAVFFGESKLIYKQDPVTANVKFNRLNYEIIPEVEQGQTPVIDFAYSLSQAVSKAPTGSTIKVLVGIEETTGVTIPANKEIVLDLNGKTTTFNIDAQSEVNFAITNNGTLTITDTTLTENSTAGKITSNKRAVTNNGTLIATGKAEINGTGSNSSTVVNDGTFTLDGATISSTNYKAIYNGVDHIDAAKVIILDGTVTAKSNAIDNNGTSNTEANPAQNIEESLSVKICGGTIEATDADVVVNRSSGTVLISGGNVKELATAGNRSTVINYGNIGKIIISGGEITSNTYHPAVHQYNNANGLIEINGGTITAQKCAQAHTGTIKITGGELKGSEFGVLVQQAGILEVGTNDGTVSITTPVISGGTYGVSNAGTFKFYDGIIKGGPGTQETPGKSINGTVTNKPQDYSIVYGTEIIDGTTYETATLQKSIPDTIINTESMYVPGAQVRVDGVHNYSNSGTEGKNYEATTWADISGSGNNGAITSNTLKWGENYLEFDGSSTWVNLGQIDNEYQTLHVTFSYDELKSGNQFVISNRQTGGGQIIVSNSGNIWGGYHINSAFRAIDSGVTAQPNKIYDVALTYDGTNEILYVNGEEKARYENTDAIANGTITPPSASGGNPTVMSLGSNPAGNTIGGEIFDGKIFSAAVYNRALTADEVLQNATASLALAGGTVSTPNLTYTVRFPDAVTGFTADDITLTNGTKGTFTEVTAGQAYTLNATLSTNSTTTSAVTQRITVAQGAATVTSTSLPTSETSRTVAIAPSYQNTTTNKCYFTLQNAFNDVNAGETIRVLNSTMEPATTQTKGTASNPVTLDLNGRTIIMTGALTNSGVLAINGNGIIEASASATVRNDGTNAKLTINGATINCKDATKYAIVTINGGDTTIISAVVNASYRCLRNYESTLTVNGGTYTTTGASLNPWAAEVISVAGGTTEISDGTFTVYQRDSSEAVAVELESGTECDVSITGGSFTGTFGIVAQSRGVLNVGGTASITATNGYGINKLGSLTINISGGTLSASGKHTIYNNNATGTITISGGEVKNTGAKAAVYNNVAGAINITGGTITSAGNHTVVNASSGTISVSGDAVISSTNTTTKYSAIGNNAGGTIDISETPIISTSKGDAIYCNGTGGSITISGGTVTGTGAGLSMGKGSATITGGTISGNNYGIWMSGDNAPTVTIGKKDGTVSNTTPIICATGKTGSVNEGIAKYSGTLNFYDGIVYAPTVAKTINGSVTDKEPNYEIVNGSATYDGTEYKFATLAIPTKNYLLHDGGTGINTYDTLSQAINAIPANANKSYRIVALNNTTEPATTQAKGTSAKPVTLDLNGKTITMSGTLTNSGYLTIDGAGTLTTSAAINLIKNDGTLNIPSTGTISNTNTGAYSLISNGNGTINKTGSGTLSSSTSNNTILGGTVNISAGTVSSSGRDAINGAWNCKISGTAHILCSTPGNIGSAIYVSSGSLTVSENAVIEKTGTGQAAVVAVASTAKATISGGTIKSVAGSAAYVLRAQGSGKVTVQGGTISSLGTGYAIYKDGTGDVEVKSGSVTGSGNSTIYNNNASGTITISGGIIENTGNTANIQTIRNESGSSLTITGGKINSTYRAIRSAGTLNITGGEITAEGVAGNSWCILPLSIVGGTVNISDGTFKSKVGTATAISGNSGSGEAWAAQISAATVTITGGKFEGETHGIFIQGGSTVTLGVNENPVYINEPEIIGKNGYGISVSNDSTFNFYDGIIKGSTGNSINGTVSDTPTGYTVRKSTADNIETAILDNHYNVQFLSGNLLEGVTLENHGITNPAGPINGVYTGTLTTTTSGWKIPASNFTVGKTYSLRFKVQKTAGILKNITGAAQAATAPQQSFIIDGKNSTCEYNISISQSTIPSNITDDTNEHVVEFKFQYLGNGTEKNIYIQPNRGYTTSVTVNLYDVELYEVVQESSKTYGSTYGTMPTVSRTGYTLAGWYTNDNLITTDKNEWEQGGITDADGTNSTNDSVAPRRLRLKEYQVIESNATYTLTTDSSSDIRIRYVYFYDTNKTFISTNYHTPGADVRQFTTPSNCKYFKVVLQKTNPDTDTITLDELSAANLTLYGTVSSTMVVPNNDVDVYAQWTANIYTITLNNQSATTAGSTAIYEKYNTGYYKEQAATNKMSTTANGITVPTKTGYAFGGYYTGTNGSGTQYIDANGKLTSSASTTNFTANGTLYAKWVGVYALYDNQGNLVNNYTSLSQAYQNLPSGSSGYIIKVLADTKETSICEMYSGGSFDLDTNGKTITFTGGAYMNLGGIDTTIYGGGTITTDTAPNSKSVTVYSGSSSSTISVRALMHVAGCTLTIDDNVSIINRISDYAILYNSNMLTIKSGNIIGAECGIYITSTSNLVIGTKENGTPIVSTTNPIIIGESSRAGIITYSGITPRINFYDGIIKGGARFTITPNEIPTGYNVNTSYDSSTGKWNTILVNSSKSNSVSSGTSTKSLLYKTNIISETNNEKLDNITENKNTKIAKVEESYYEDINSAIQAAIESGKTITLLDDIELSEEITIDSDKQLSLNLNDKTIIGKSTNTIINNGKLSITGPGIIKNEAENGVVIYNTGDLNIENVKVIVSEDDSIGIYNARDSKACVIKNTDIIMEAKEIENYELIKNTDQFKEELERMKPSYGIYNDSEIDVVLESGTIRVERLKGVGILNNFEGSIILGVDESKEGKEIDLNTGSPIIYATADNTTALINSKEGTINFYDGRILSTSTIKNIITNSLKGYEINEEFNSNSISATLKLLKAED